VYQTLSQTGAKYNITDGITLNTGDISKIFVSKNSKNPSDNAVISYISELDWRRI